MAHAWKVGPAHPPRPRAGRPGSPADFRGLDDLARLPVTRKDALPGLQAAEPPFGGLAGVDPGALARLFMSPGPIYDPQGHDGDFWRFRHAMAAAGYRRGDVVLNSGSYHLTPLGFMLDAGARALGCAVIPGGVGQTELQLKAASHLKATAYTGTPSFLFQLLTRARETGTPLFFEVAFVIAEMLPEIAAGRHRGLRRPLPAGLRHRRPRLPLLRVRRAGRLAPPPRGPRRGARPRDRRHRPPRASPARSSPPSSTRPTR